MVLFSHGRGLALREGDAMAEKLDMVFDEEKLEEAPKLIENVWGAGYRLNGP